MTATVTRQRTVYPSCEIAHLWAHQTRSNARNGGGNNHSFDGQRLYSYAAVIAQLHLNAKGETAALLTTQRWSVTTAKHQSWARQATSHMPHFEVPSIGSRYGGTEPDHDANWQDYRKRVGELAGGVKRARANKGWKLNSLRALIGEANRYADFFDLEVIRLDLDADINELAAEVDRLEAETAERARLSTERARVDAAEKIGQWKDGADVRVPYLPEAYLRLEGDEVVTSHGARVPADHVCRALRIVVKLIERGETYHDNGRTIHLGHYKLDSIDSVGDVRAGCHYFQRAEVLRFNTALQAYCNGK